jgi:transcriptional regulator with XRE-family HTH domain
MNLQSEKTLRFAKKALESHIVAMAADKGIKITKARAQIANDIGVDPSSIRQFLNGEVVKPAPKTMQKYVDWLGVNPEKVEKSGPESKQELREQLDAVNEKLIDTERRLRASEAQIESTRKRFVEKRERVEELEALLAIDNHDPDLVDKYKIVHPDNAWWMEYSDAYITINTQGEEADFHSGPKQRVCTIPIPNLNLSSTWHHKVPPIQTYKDGKWEMVESDYWFLVDEDDKGQVWQRPNVDIDGQFYPSETVLVETREQYSARKKIETQEHIALLVDIAQRIGELYAKCGGWPDNEVTVDVEINNIENI